MQNFLVYGPEETYKCYPFTENDLGNINALISGGYNESIAEFIACENRYGRFYSAKAKVPLPGCAKCSCCQIRHSGMNAQYE